MSESLKGSFGHLINPTKTQLNAQIEERKCMWPLLREAAIIRIKSEQR
ncbi:hypothetical protein [Kangiella sediminilitoris]|nr:hypothetical protein [Kangiella sediminilitoris]